MNYRNVFLILCILMSLLWTCNKFTFIVVGLFLSLSFDIHAVWRNVLVLYFCKMRRRYKPKKLTDTNIFKVVCLPTDVDVNLHLTPGRLLRECGFGQTEFWVENFVKDNVERLKGEIRVESYHMTYDYPVRVFETFKIIARILYWDENAFYMKQTVVRNKDKKECATILSVHRLTGVTTAQILEGLGSERVPTKPVTSSLVRQLQEINTDISEKL